MRRLCRNRTLVQRNRFCVMIRRGMRVAFDAGLIMSMTVSVNMWHKAVIVHMDYTGHIVVAGKAIGDGMTAGQCKRDRRRQHAK